MIPFIYSIHVALDIENLIDNIVTLEDILKISDRKYKRNNLALRKLIHTWVYYGKFILVTWKKCLASKSKNVCF